MRSIQAFSILLFKWESLLSRMLFPASKFCRLKKFAFKLEMDCRVILECHSDRAEQIWRQAKSFYKYFFFCFGIADCTSEGAFIHSWALYSYVAFEAFTRFILHVIIIIILNIILNSCIGGDGVYVTNLHCRNCFGWGPT